MAVWPSMLIAATSIVMQGQPAGPRYALEAPGVVAFEVETSAGPVKGTIPIKNLEIRGPKWGRFLFRLSLDAAHVDTGDAVRDTFIAEQVLRAGNGPLAMASTERIDPPWNPNGEPTEPPRAKCWMDAARKGAYVELTYTWKGKGENGVLTFTHEAPAEKLGLTKLPHPFIKLTGPVKFSFSGQLARRR